MRSFVFSVWVIENTCSFDVNLRILYNYSHLLCSPIQIYARSLIHTTSENAPPPQRDRAVTQGFKLPSPVHLLLCYLIVIKCAVQAQFIQRWRWITIPHAQGALVSNPH